MDNNKPIINGIDVSECDYFEKQHIEDMYESDDCNVCIDNYCALCWKECEKYNGCYFKQLQRLKQENEELKQNWRLDCLKCEYKNTKADVDKYRQALEEIRDRTIHPDGLPENCTLKKYILFKINEVLK